jgi:fucose 4-O-acetylase-like acetyltransferase
MTQTSAHPSTVEETGRVRDPLLDNARLLAVLLVVGQGAIAGLRETVPSGHALYVFVGLFAIPLLVTVSGYLSREFSFSKGKSRELIVKLVVPYVIFETAYALFAWLAGGKDLSITLLTPSIVTWFLMALFFWRLSTPVWQQIRWPLPVSIVFALACYCGPLSYQLDMHRVFGLAPFYVLGLSLRPEHFDRLRQPHVRLAGAFFLIGALLLSFVAKDHLGDGWVAWRDSNDALAASNALGSALHVALYGAGAVLGAAFLAVVPRRRFWFTALGAFAIYGYLLHGFFLKFASYHGLDNAHHLRNAPAMAALFLLAAAFSLLLCSAPVVRLTRWAVQPTMEWAFRNPDQK